VSDGSSPYRRFAMADAGTTARGIAHDVSRAFRALNLEQRVAAVAALLLIASTFGPFSFVEAAEVVLAGAVLALLYLRGSGREFHLPLGDGTAIAAAGIWAGLLIVVRLFDRPLGQNLLALVCAAILALAGLRERAKRPADDLPPAPAPRLPREETEAARAASRARRRARRAAVASDAEIDPATAAAESERLWDDPPAPGPPPEEPLAPPEFELPSTRPAMEAEDEFAGPAPHDDISDAQLSLEDDEPTRRPSRDPDA
jgi:hypothetical protein